MPGFQRVNPLGTGLIRGPARVLIEPLNAPYPLSLNQIIYLSQAGWTQDVQTVTLSAGITGGTFQLTFWGYTSAAIAYNATNAAVSTALNAMPSVVTAGGVTVTGSAGGPWPVTFVTTGVQQLMGGASSGLSDGGTVPTVTVTHTVTGNTLYDPVGQWVELGSTKTGVSVGRNNTEQQLDVDQILGAILAVPDEWEMTLTTAFAETTLENIQYAWEGGAITTDTTQQPNERHEGMGNPLSYTNRRLAVVHQKVLGSGAGRIRAHVFRNVIRSPQNSGLMFNKAGEQQTLSHIFRAFVDPQVADPNARFGEVIEQVDVS